MPENNPLTKKVGPLPLWAWALIGGVLLYVIRQRLSGGGSSSGTNSTAATQAEAQLVQAEGEAAAGMLQSQSILTPGESVYDPNSGLLLGTNNGNNAGNTQVEQSIIALIAAMLQPQRRGQNSSRGQKGKTKHPRRQHKGSHPKQSNKPKEHAGRFVNGQWVIPEPLGPGANRQRATARGQDKLHKMGRGARKRATGGDEEAGG